MQNVDSILLKFCMKIEKIQFSPRISGFESLQGTKIGSLSRFVSRSSDVIAEFSIETVVLLTVDYVKSGGPTPGLFLFDANGTNLKFKLEFTSLVKLNSL